MIDQSLEPSGHIKLQCVSFGVPFRVTADDPSLLDDAAQVLPYRTELVEAAPSAPCTFTLTSPHDNHGFRISTNSIVSFEHAERAAVLDQLKENLMVHVADHAPDRVFVHAGVVGWQGSAIVLPGRSFAGKTTLVAELVKAGATYYSDEYAVLDDEGRVHPYARELQMRRPGNPQQRGVPVESLSGTAGTEPLPVAQVLFSQFESGAGWSPTPVSPGLAVLEMIRHTIPVQRTPARVMATLGRMMEHATAWQSQRGDAAQTARLILHPDKEALA